MNINWNDIKKEYIDSKGRVVLKELAEKHGVKIGTLRSRKSREDWDSEIDNSVATCNATKEKKSKNVATHKKAMEAKKDIVKDIDKEIVEEVLENKELTDEQQLFCIYYVRCYNATKAYQKAYGCDYISAMSNSSRLIRNDKIRSQIESLKQHKLNRAMISEDDIFQKYIDIAFADITDFSEFGTKELFERDSQGNILLDEEGNPRTYKINYVNIKESSEVDGTIVTEISQGKDGVKVKLADKIRAMQWLADRMDLLPTKDRVKLQGQLEEQNARIEKLKADTAKITGATTDIEDLSEIYGEIYGDN